MGRQKVTKPVKKRAELTQLSETSKTSPQPGGAKRRYRFRPGTLAKKEIRKVHVSIVYLAIHLY